MTLDPISRVKCRTPFTRDRSSNKLLGGVVKNYIQACLEAPTDITPNEYQSILNQSNWWINYYQTEAPYLHSSEIFGAENILVDDRVGSVFDIFGPHVRLDSNQDAWDDFHIGVMQALGVY